MFDTSTRVTHHTPVLDGDMVILPCTACAGKGFAWNPSVPYVGAWEECASCRTLGWVRIPKTDLSQPKTSPSG